MNVERREPDAVDSIRLMAILLFLAAGVGGLGSVWKGMPPAASNLLLELCFLAAPLLYARAVGLRPLASSGFARITWRQAALVLLAAAGSLWLFKGLLDLQEGLLSRLGLDVAAEREMLRRSVEAMEEKGSVFALGALALAPALCEETFFRGILLRGFAAGLHPFRALVYTSLLFAAMHSGGVQSVMMAFMGFYFGALVWLTGSVWAGVIAHAVNNAAVVALQRLYGPRVAEMRPTAGMLALSAAVFGLAVLLLALERRAAPPGPPRP